MKGERELVRLVVAWWKAASDRTVVEAETARRYKAMTAHLRRLLPPPERRP